MRHLVVLLILGFATAGAGFGGANARIEAQFTIRAGGAVTPRTITVPPRAQAERRFNRLRAGTYGLDVDGARKAALDIGGAPGP